MNGTNEEPASTPPPDNLGSLTPQQLAELASNPDMIGSARAEVCRRLKDDPHKANFLTFRWFLPADEEDQADAFDGLIGCCWRATEKRIFPFGLFPEGYLKAREAIFNKTRNAILDALVDYLYGFKGLSVQENVLTVLNGGFQTDVWVGNAVRQRVRQERKNLAYGDDTRSDGEGNHVTLFEFLPDNVDRANHYNEAVESIFQERAEVVEELGEEGWEVLEEIVEHEDQGMLPNTKRDRQRLLTEMFQTAYGVRERQARTHKSRFLAAIEAGASERKRVFECIAELLDRLGCWDGEKY